MAFGLHCADLEKGRAWYAGGTRRSKPETTETLVDAARKRLWIKVCIPLGKLASLDADLRPSAQGLSAQTRQNSSIISTSWKKYFAHLPRCSMPA
jgi:hypothetical protein